MSAGVESDDSAGEESRAGPAVEAAAGESAGDGASLRPEDPDAFEAELWDALDGIPDPHIPVSLVEMGMIYGVVAEDGRVSVELTYPCMGCPAYDMIQNDVRSCLRVVDGVEAVDVEVVWDPPWSKERLSSGVREEMREAGIGL